MKIDCFYIKNFKSTYFGRRNPFFYYPYYCRTPKRVLKTSSARTRTRLGAARGEQRPMVRARARWTVNNVFFGCLRYQHTLLDHKKSLNPTQILGTFGHVFGFWNHCASQEFRYMFQFDAVGSTCKNHETYEQWFVVFDGFLNQCLIRNILSMVERLLRVPYFTSPYFVVIRSESICVSSLAMVPSRLIPVYFFFFFL